jgi:hypothetical protein
VVPAGTTKPCVVCHKPIAASFQKCSFCSADQPVTSVAPSPKEKRCGTCKRPYSAKLEACPFCARDRADGVVPAAFGASAPRRSVTPSSLDEEDDDDGEPRVLGSALLFGGPLVLGALWGLVHVLSADRLGGQESSGVMGESIVVGLFVAPALAALFLRRTYRTFADAVDRHGLSKVLLIGFGATAVMLAPAALFAAGVVYWGNGIGAESRVRMVDCKVGSVWSRARKGGETSWQMSYSCDVEGDHVSGTLTDLPTRPDYVDGQSVTFRAARGRFGLWLRFGDPIPPTPPPAS